jgi:DNA-binding transcriptional regulator YdaS (Cro superfamily)
LTVDNFRCYLDNMTTTLIQTAIDRFGSEAKLAAAADVSQAAINKAKHAPRVSAEMAVRIERATNGQITREQLRPDLFQKGTDHAVTTP